MQNQATDKATQLKQMVAQLYGADVANDSTVQGYMDKLIEMAEYRHERSMEPKQVLPTSKP